MARFFLVLLGLLAAAGGLVELYASGGSQIRAVLRHLDGGLSQSAQALPLVLASDPALSLAREAAQSPSLRATLRELDKGSTAPGPQVLAAASIAVSAVAEGEEPIVLVVNRHGAMAVRRGEEVAVDAGAARAFLEEALWSGEKNSFIALGGKLHRLLGVAVEDAGVLALALPVDDAFARQTAAALGAELTWMWEGKAEASSLSTRSRLQVVEGALGAGDQPFSAGALPADYRLFGQIPLPLFAEEALGSYRALGVTVPEAAQNGVRILLATNTSRLLDPIVASQGRLLLISAGLLLLGLVFALVGKSANRQPAGLERLAHLSEQLLEGDPNVSVLEFRSGPLGRLARVIHELSAQARRAAGGGLGSSILEAQDEPPGDLEDSFAFGKGREQNDEEEPLLASPMPREEGGGPSIFDPPPLPDEGPAFGGGGEGLFGPAGSFGDGASAGPDEEPTAKGVSPFGARGPGEEAGPAWDAPTRPLPTSSAGWTPLPGPASDAGDSTAVGAVPDALLRATSQRSEGPEASAEPGAPAGAGAPGPTQPAQPPPPAAPAADDEAHLREVYERFIETRQQCGETFDGITYEKFAAKLRTNRAQLLERFQCRSVRFTVYVKEGKAALKATPIR